MKTPFPLPFTLTATLTLAALSGRSALFAGEAAPGLAPPRPPAPPVAEAAAALAEAGRQLEQVKVQVAAALAQAGAAGGLGVQLHPVAEPPEPPEPPEPAAPLPGFEAAGGVLHLLGGEGRGNVPQALIVPAEEASESKLAELREDLAVFSRILGKAAGDERRRGQDMALGIVVSTFPTLRRPEALYLEGYGAVLLLSVPFPLAAPAAEKDAPASDKPADSLWERTRQELFGGGPGGPTPPGADPFRGEFWERILPDAKGAPYDARRVEKLQRDLVEALQHGTHLRHVRPEEYLVVVVTGASAAPRHEVRVERRLGRGGTAETRREQVIAGTGVPGAETLVLRVKKAEADALAAGKISFEEFRQRVSVRLY